MADNAEATSRLWKSFSNDLLHFIQKRVSTPEDAEDILHDVYIKIHTGYHTIKSHERIHAWIYRITRNTIIDYYRKNKRVTVDIDTMQDLLETDLTFEENEDLLKCLKPFIENLSADYREAFELVDMENISQAEFARLKGLSVSGAKSRVQRARNQLQNDLYDCCNFEFDDNGAIAEYTVKEKSGRKGYERCICGKIRK
ncbi:MAG: RNA polymerase sigma factor SigZ [Spirochaetota bacterium]